MSRQIKIPKKYRTVVGQMAEMDVGSAKIFDDGRVYNPIAQLLSDVVIMKRGVVVKKKRFDWDGCSIEL